jgi:hypothetical protein
MLAKTIYTTLSVDLWRLFSITLLLLPQAWIESYEFSAPLTLPFRDFLFSA